MASTGVGETLLAALQASVSVLLVISYGGLAAKLGILSPDSTKAVSKVCVRMFLPALLITKLGAELDAGSAGKYGIIVVWGLLAHFISFLIGILGHMVFKMPDWVTVAVYVIFFLFFFSQDGLCIIHDDPRCYAKRPRLEDILKPVLIGPLVKARSSN